MSIQQSLRSGLLRRVRKFGLTPAKRWPWPVAATLSTGRRIYVDLRSSIGRGIFMTGEFDPGVAAPLSQVLRHGDTFLDIGANVGYYSMLALDLVGSSGHVHAFEVDKRALRCLRKAEETQRLGNFTIHAMAVGDHDGTAAFHEDMDSGHSRLAPPGSGAPVVMATLDHWSDRIALANVRAVKIDIEGAEILALRGARSFIKAHRPVWVCEVWENDLSRPGEAVSFLRDFGYRVERLENVYTPTVVAWP